MNEIDFLIQYLLKENKNINIDNMPEREIDKENLWRSLCNIRNAQPIDKEYLDIEKRYLQEKMKENKISKVQDIKTIKEEKINSNLHFQEKICLWKGDITKLEIDAIVNAGNSQGLGCFIPCHKCIDNQIHTFAGISLRNECNEIMKEKEYFLNTGDVFITKGYNLPAQYVIHTVGPIITNDVTEQNKKDLMNCYINSLSLAIKNKIKNIAFPCISTGEFRFPKEEACNIAILAVQEFLDKYDNSFERIIFNVYSEEDYKIYKNKITC